MTRRPVIPMRTKLDVVIRQEGKCACGCGEKLGELKNTEFDHVPALCFRDYDEETGKYTPDANDPTRIFAKLVEHHGKKTKRDVSALYKAKRLAKGPKVAKRPLSHSRLRKKVSGEVVQKEKRT